MTRWLLAFGALVPLYSAQATQEPEALYNRVCVACHAGQLPNANGGAIALGHPLGASGARLMTGLLNQLEQSGGRYGLQTMCEGGGQANVTIIERL